MHKSKQRPQKKRKRASANLCNTLLYKATKSKQETSQKNIKRSCSETNKKADSRVKEINRLQKQQKEKCVHKKLLKSGE